MPQSRRSLRLTDAYRARLLLIGDTAEREARRRWPTIEQLDETDWPERTAAELTLAQRQAVRLTAGYLSAYLRSEGASGTAPAINSSSVGKSRDGRALSEALLSPLIGVKAKLKAGEPPSVALAYGLQRATRMVKFETVQSGRDVLSDSLKADPRLEDHGERSVAGTCAACMALSGASGPRFEVHPGCECLEQPIVKGAVNKFPLPSGAALFGALSKAEQETAIGSEPARLVRDGEADLKDFVAHSPQEEQSDFLTQRPVEQVA